MTPTSRKVLETERENVIGSIKRNEAEVEGLEKNMAAAIARLEANQQYLDNLNKDLETE